MQNVKNNGKKVCLINLGCKVNKYEIDCMANILASNGYEVSFNHEPADFYVLGSCAVTNEAEKKSRQYVSKLTKLNPESKVIVVGCASEHNPEQFRKKNVISVIGNEGREHILELLEGNNFKPYQFSTTYNSSVSNPFRANTRAYLKIQDGCNNFCSYCLIPYVRGRSRSRSVSEILEEAKSLSQNANEIVLTGIDVSSYKTDDYDLGDLIFLLRDLPVRIRLSSFEVRIINEEFLEKLSKTKNFCPHFHLSLQSGSSSVLKRMNRHYTKEDYLNRIALIKSYFPDANITTDIIVGFPEETDAEFEETMQTCAQAKFGHVHIFPYSVRGGTVAEKFKQVDDQTKQKRVKLLTKHCKNIEQSFYESMLNKTFTMLTEEEQNGFMQGYTENYIKVLVKNKNLKPNQFVKVKLKKVVDGAMVAEIV